jgi:hypothetical protein
MKPRKAGRKPRPGIPRRPLIRLSPELCEVYDRYTDKERDEIFNRALTTIFPAVPDSPPTPTIIRPKKVVGSAICRVVTIDRLVSLVYPEKREDFRMLVKGFRYQWTTRWQRKFSDKADIVDRVAEISNEILLLGIPVQIDCEMVRDRLLSSSFVPESFKRVMGYTADPYKDWFTFEYPKGEDWYSEIMKLTAAKYTDGLIVVPPEQFAEVEDFAEINDFELTEKALSIVATARSVAENAIIFQPRRKTRKSRKKEVNVDTNSIPAHLRDDD